MDAYLRKMERRIANMGRMMHQLGVPALDGRSDKALQVGAAARRCAFCRWSEECERWLAAPTDKPNAYRTFCPNAETFDRLSA